MVGMKVNILIHHFNKLLVFIDYLVGHNKMDKFRIHDALQRQTSLKLADYWVLKNFYPL